MQSLYFWAGTMMFFLIIINGCSTLKTTAHYTLGSPKLYSGTRMDLDTINKSEDYVLKKYNVKGPDNPNLDLPFSLLLDTAILPVVIPVALSDVFFE
jgi:uncharacterized protein YceK